MWEERNRDREREIERGRERECDKERVRKREWEGWREGWRETELVITAVKTEKAWFSLNFFLRNQWKFQVHYFSNVKKFDGNIQVILVDCTVVPVTDSCLKIQWIWGTFQRCFSEGHCCFGFFSDIIAAYNHNIGFACFISCMVAVCLWEYLYSAFTHLISFSLLSESVSWMS